MQPAGAEVRVQVSQAAVDHLQRQLSGYVLQPGNPDYQTALQIDNGRIQLQPTIIILANSEKDVVTALRFAQKEKLRLTVLGGGHSATGYCLNTGGVVVDLSLMKGMALDVKRRTLRVQMGAIWKDVYAYLQNSGTSLIPVGGGCLTVGLPGFVQGGGFSFVSRSYGMSVDNLHSVKIVTVDGELREVSERSKSKEETGLFWALRGGGGGNTQQEARTTVEWGFKFFQALEPHFKGSYVNYIDPLLSGWQHKYYEQNYKRLLEVKQHWDPQNFFHFQQSIGSQFEPDTNMPLDLSPLNRTFVG